VSPGARLACLLTCPYRDGALCASCPAQIEDKVKEISDLTEISMFVLSTEPIKTKLCELVARWKSQYSASLRKGAKQALERLAEFIEDHLSRLSRSLADPDLAEIAEMVGVGVAPFPCRI